MSTTPNSRYVFKHAALQNKAIADNLAKFAARSRATRQVTSPVYEEDVVSSSPVLNNRMMYRDMDMLNLRYKMSYRRNIARPFLGITVIVAGLVAIGFVVGPTLYNLIVASWKTILLALGGVCVGSGCILLFGRIGKQPLKNLEPPDGASDQPLTELERLAIRTVSRLKTAYRMQIFLICIVAALLLLVVLWSIFMVTTNKLMYATAFGSSGIGMLVLSKWKWQPFERVAEARKFADDADILAAGLRLRIKSISEITDPKERAQAQWEAVSEYLDRS